MRVFIGIFFCLILVSCGKEKTAEKKPTSTVKTNPCPPACSPVPTGQKEETEKQDTSITSCPYLFINYCVKVCEGADDYKNTQVGVGFGQQLPQGSSGDDYYDKCYDRCVTELRTRKGGSFSNKFPHSFCLK